MRRACQAPQSPTSSSAGFSLVELMVAMSLSLILLGGVLAIFASSRTTYEATDRLSRIQENGRFALDSITRDIRSAGYTGCSVRAPFNNTLNNSGSILWNFERAVEGIEDGEDADVSVMPDAVTGSDILILRYPRHGAPSIRVEAPMTNGTDDIVIEDALKDTIDVNDIVMISDCSGRAVFEVTAKAANTISHQEAAPAPEPEAGPEPAEPTEPTPTGNGDDDTSATPGNVSGDLGYVFTAGAELVPMETAVYYLRPSSAGGGISLWRRLSGGDAQELVEGVENMQLAFGVQNAGGDITYERASEVTDWSAVVSVAIALLVRSPSEYGAQTDDTSYQLLNTAVGETVTAPNDRRMRQVFTTTVTLRNATL